MSSTCTIFFVWQLQSIYATNIGLVSGKKGRRIRYDKAYVFRRQLSSAKAPVVAPSSTEGSR